MRCRGHTNASSILDEGTVPLGAMLILFYDISFEHTDTCYTQNMIALKPWQIVLVIIKLLSASVGSISVYSNVHYH